MVTFFELHEVSHNKRMQSNFLARYARKQAADAWR
jgi:hypothetical protein